MFHWTCYGRNYSSPGECKWSILKSFLYFSLLTFPYMIERSKSSSLSRSHITQTSFAVNCTFGAIWPLCIHERLGSAPDVLFHLCNACFSWNWIYLIQWRSEGGILSAPGEYSWDILIKFLHFCLLIFPCRIKWSNSAFKLLRPYHITKSLYQGDSCCELYVHCSLLWPSLFTTGSDQLLVIGFLNLGCAFVWIIFPYFDRQAKEKSAQLQVSVWKLKVKKTWLTSSKSLPCK